MGLECPTGMQAMGPASRIRGRMAAFQRDVFKHVEGALFQMEEVKKAKVNLKAGQVKVTFARGTDVTSMFDEVRNVGYEMGPLGSEAT